MSPLQGRWGIEVVHSPRGLSLRREWGFAPLRGAAATFSGYSKDPSRPVLGYLALSGHMHPNEKLKMVYNRYTITFNH